MGINYEKIISNFFFKTLSMKTNSFSIGITKGVIFAILGLLLIIYPIQVVKTVTTIFGIASLITGAIVLFSAISKRGKGESAAVFPLIEGAFSVIFGLILVLVPSISLTILAIMVGVWVIIEGILRISTSFDMKNAGINLWGRSLFVGLLFLILGILVIFHPELTSKALIMWIGFALLIFGIIDILIVYQLKNIHLSK